MMNKDEAVQKLATAGRLSIAHAEDLYDSFFPKPVVPKYVADWIEYCKFTNVNLGRALFISDIDFYNYESQEDCSKLKEFLGTETNQETFALAWTLGYEVEKEKRYRVKIKGVNDGVDCLVFGKVTKKWKFRESDSFEEIRKHHTRKELEEAGFGWVFDCPGIEVKEVADE